MEMIEQIRALRPVDLFKDRKSVLTERRFRQMCSGVPIWHSVDLGDLFIEGARKTAAVTLVELQRADLPDFFGKSVLDIGAFGGWYSFEAERRGARHVVALEYYSWGYDWGELGRYIVSERAAGRPGNAHYPPSNVIDEKGQPGRRVFDLTKSILDSSVQPVFSRFQDYCPGYEFDIVLLLGIVYHFEEPLGALRRVAALTKDHLVMETLCVHLPGQEAEPIWEFLGDDPTTDPTEWWAANECGITSMLKAAGFAKVQIKYGAGSLTAEQRLKKIRFRAWVHAWK